MTAAVPDRDVTAQAAAVLAEHADCTPNSAVLDPGSAVTHVDHWSCGLEAPFEERLEDAERAHVAAALAAAGLLAGDPAVDAARAEGAEKAAATEALLRRVVDEERIRHDHAYPMELGPHHCDGCDLEADLRAIVGGEQQ